MSRKSQHTRFEDQILGQVSLWGCPASRASLGECIKKERRMIKEALLISSTSKWRLSLPKWMNFRKKSERSKNFKTLLQILCIINNNFGHAFPKNIMKKVLKQAQGVGGWQRTFSWNLSILVKTSVPKLKWNPIIEVDHLSAAVQDQGIFPPGMLMQHHRCVDNSNCAFARRLCNFPSSDRAGQECGWCQQPAPPPQPDPTPAGRNVGRTARRHPRPSLVIHTPTHHQSAPKLQTTDLHPLHDLSPPAWHFHHFPNMNLLHAPLQQLL